MRVRVFAGVAGAAALVVAGTPAQSPARADTTPTAGLPATVSADGLPTVQINGVVWAETIVGTIVYATGNFSSARPAGAAVGTHETQRGNLLAFDITTGNLITSFSHSLNAQGLAIAASPDGSRVYVGGDFTAVDGKARNHVAAFDVSTGALDTAFAPSINGSVKAVTAADTSVYVGGDFTRVGTTNRTRLAAISPTGTLQKWAPTADDSSVTALVLTPAKNRVIIGGRFTTINHKAAYGIGAVDSGAGASSAWPTNFPVRDAGVNSDITTLTTDGSQVYGTGYVFGSGGNFEGTFAVNPDTGALNWLESCHGDSYGSYATGQAVYVVSHAHDCSDIGAFDDAVPRVNHRGLAFTTYPTGKEVKNNNANYANFQGEPDPTQLHWYPDIAIGSFTGQHQGAWSITGNAQFIAIGGEFPAVNGVPQQGLVRMAIGSRAPNKIGPIASTTLTPRVSSPTAGKLVVSWKATSDEDNAVLSYNVYRDGASAPVATVSASSAFWTLPSLSFTDSGLLRGSTHTYRISATDPFGNTVLGNTSGKATVT